MTDSTSKPAIRPAAPPAGRFAGLADAGVVVRTLWMYGLGTVLSNAAYLIGYYLLPEGLMRGGPYVSAGEVAATGSFASEFAMTLVFNLGITVTLILLLNLNRVRGGLPLGYLLLVSYGLVSGLVAGTNSFVASNLRDYTAWDGNALGLSIGGLETLAFVLVAAATTPLGIYDYPSWWRWGGKWKAVKRKPFREVRLSRPEIVCLVIAVILLMVAAYRETVMALGAG
jgi:hypothetical protein